MKRFTLCLAVAGFMISPASAWADRACCGESVEIQSSAQNTDVQVTQVSTTPSSPCRPGQPCPGGGEARSESPCPTGSPCAACPAETSACPGEIRVYPPAQTCDCPVRTTYRLVRECQPVARVRTVCRRDPCNPCRVVRTRYTEWTNRTRYRWVAEVTPVCPTSTVRIYRPAEPACCGETTHVTKTTPTQGHATLATATPRK